MTDNKVLFAAATFCGHCTAMTDKIVEEGLEDQFDIVYCDADGASHAACKGEGGFASIEGFPTFYNAAKEVCQLGAAKDAASVLAKCQ